MLGYSLLNVISNSNVKCCSIFISNYVNENGYTIEMTPTNFADVVQMKTKTSQTTGKLRYGNTTRVSFRYVFTKAARDKTIPMEIKYIFQGKVMRSQIIELRPK